MFKKLQAKLRNKKGFTLVELLIVIAVLGIIAAIAVPRFTGVLGGVKDKADVRAAELWAKEIQAEFMVESWDTSKDITVGPIADTPRKGFDGAIPNDNTGKPMVATIKTTTDTTTKVSTYSLSIVNGANAELLKATDIQGPIN